MSHWNYRVVHEELEDGSSHFSIREVFFDDDGQVEGWSDGPIAPAAETWVELAEELVKMQRAIGAAILDTTLDPPALVGVLEFRRRERGA